MIIQKAHMTYHSLVSPTSAWVLRRGTLQRVVSYYVALLVLLILSSAIYFGQDERTSSEVLFFDNPIKPSYLYYLTYALTGTLLIAVPDWLRPKSEGLIVSMLLFGLIHLLWMPFVPTQAIQFRTLVLRLNVVVLAICFQILLSMVDDFGPILRAVRVVVWGTTVLNGLVVLTPQMFTVSMGHFEGRAAGLFGDPNQCATMLAMLLPLAVYGKPFWSRLMYYLLIFGSIFFTFSRSGMVGWALMVLLDMTFRPGQPRVGVRSIMANVALACGFAVLIGLILMLTWGDLIPFLLPNLNADTVARLNGTDMGSSNERLYVLQLGYEVFKEHPLLGSGYASTRDWDFGVSVHNMFILVVAEFGMVGGLWYLDFIRRIFLFPGRFGLVLGFFVVAESFFTHSYFEFPFYILAVLLIWRLSHLSEFEMIAKGTRT